ncbi:hypothetical protein IJ541_08875 [bacterium]|nr:hypothetical protein [bacterium]MBQ9245993.1 hypothetical protein [bacterium]MBQ9246904.1 hypothetical protein [bacterium]
MSVISFIPKVTGYVTRIAKAAPDAIFGASSDIAGAAMRSTKGSVWTKAKAGFKAVEDLQKNGSFFTRVTSNLKFVPELTKKYARAARISGKGPIASFFAGPKGFFKGLGKNVPFLTALPMVLFELPNIWKATTEQGIGQGVTEVVKTGARLGGGAIGGAIGSAICPGVGSLIGWLAGEWLAKKIVGSSYSEKKAEAEEQAQIAQATQAQTQPQVQTPSFEGNPFSQNTAMSNPFSNNEYVNPYADDIMMQGMNFNIMA